MATEAPRIGSALGVLHMPVRLDATSDSNRSWIEGQQLSSRSLQSIQNNTPVPVGVSRPHSTQGVSAGKMDVDALLESLEEFPSAPPTRPPSASPPVSPPPRPHSALRENRWLAAAKNRQGNDVDSLLEDLDAALTTMT